MVLILFPPLSLFKSSWNFLEKWGGGGDTLAVMFWALLLFHLHAWLIVSDVHNCLYANNPSHQVSLSQECVWGSAVLSFLFSFATPTNTLPTTLGLQICVETLCYWWLYPLSLCFMVANEFFMLFHCKVALERSRGKLTCSIFYLGPEAFICTFRRSPWLFWGKWHGWGPEGIHGEKRWLLHSSWDDDMEKNWHF